MVVPGQPNSRTRRERFPHVRTTAGIWRGCGAECFQHFETKSVMVRLDDQGDPKQGTLVAQRFCDDEAMLSVIANFNSGVTIPDPRTADRGGYTNFCTFMVVMHGHIKIA